MNTIFALGATAFFLCLLLTPLCRNLSLRLDIVDHPDDERKFHAAPIPRIGGIAIVASYAGALLLVFLMAPASAKLYIRHQHLLWSLLPAAGIIFLTGLIDDLFTIKPWQKLAGQLLGAGTAIAMGTHFTLINHAAASTHPLLASPWVTIPISLIWLIGCTNAVNLIDGLDGLAAGVGLLATITMLLAGLLSGNIGLVVATVPLAACLLAFLCYNFNPASIFLGDSGSLTVGFMLGCFALVWSQRSQTLLGMTAPLMALALPLFDVGLAVCRRGLRRVPIFKGDRGHIHHMVLARGFHPRAAALILYGVCAVAAALALLQSFGFRQLHGLATVGFILLASIGINYLGYIELGAARRALSYKRVFRIVRDEIYLHDLERALERAATLEDCWDIVASTFADMGFARIEMNLHGSFFEVGGSSSMRPGWKLTIPLGQSGSLQLLRNDGEPPPKLMVSVVERMQTVMARKAPGTNRGQLVTFSGAA
jgi:UDP-GlcNAc:undecaprenyl-phosphate GlcNAc-1-phosphate transferase